jgi:hypothetical protein
MLDVRRFEEAAKIGSNVAYGMSESDGMSEHFPAALLRATSGFVHPLRFNFLELDQEGGCRNLRDGRVTELREDESLQHPLRLLVGLERTFAPTDLAGEGSEVVSCDLLESRGSGEPQLLLLGLALGTRVPALSDQTAGGIAPLTGHR